MESALKCVIVQLAKFTVNDHTTKGGGLVNHKRAERVIHNGTSPMLFSSLSDVIVGDLAPGMWREFEHCHNLNTKQRTQRGQNTKGRVPRRFLKLLRRTPSSR